MITNNPPQGSSTDLTNLTNRVNSLESQVSKNTQDIQDNLSADVLKATEVVTFPILTGNYETPSSSYNVLLTRDSSNYNKIIVIIPKILTGNALVTKEIPAQRISIIKNQNASVQMSYYYTGNKWVAGFVDGIANSNNNYDILTATLQYYSNQLSVVFTAKTYTSGGTLTVEYY